MKSLRVHLLLWVLLPMTVVLALTATLSWRSAVDTAQAVQDRQLLASAEMMAGQIRWNGGVMVAQTPPAALAMFASEAHDRVYFQVLGPNGELLAGWPDLSTVSRDRDKSTRYRSVVFRGRDVRMVTLTRYLFKSGIPQAVSVSVAESRKSFDQLVTALWKPTLLRESALLVLALVLMLVGLTRELQPLLRLRRDLEEREFDDLGPLRAGDLQRELQPFVETINQYAARLTQQVSIQKRFITDAAHQLRTPVALISAQVDYASHFDETSPELREVLGALRAGSRRLKTLINQLLTLSRAEGHRASAVPMQRIALVDVVQDVLVDLAVIADEKQIELEVSAPDGDVTVMAHPALLDAMVFNLIDNAIRYSPREGSVMVHIQRIEAKVELRIDDTGPGIPAELRAHVFERFNRGSATDNGGFGLGLAIVSEAAKACQAKVELRGRSGAPGLSAVVTLVAGGDP